MKNVMSPPTCIIIPLHAKVVKGCGSNLNTITLRHSGYDHHIMPFVYVEVKECIEHVGDKEEE